MSQNILTILSRIENDKININCKFQVYTVIYLLIIKNKKIAPREIK